MTSLRNAVEKLQDIMEVRGTYTIHVSPCLKHGEFLQYHLKYNEEHVYLGTEDEVIAFIEGAVYAELA
jgi:hypothetical protein